MTSPESEVRRRALALVDGPWIDMGGDVSRRYLRNHEIEIIELRSGSKIHSLTIYTYDERWIIGLAYRWEKTLGVENSTSEPANLAIALSMLRKMQVLDDLASI